VLAGLGRGGCSIFITIGQLLLYCCRSFQPERVNCVRPVASWALHGCQQGRGTLTVHGVNRWPSCYPLGCRHLPPAFLSERRAESDAKGGDGGGREDPPAEACAAAEGAAAPAFAMHASSPSNNQLVFGELSRDGGAGRAGKSYGVDACSPGSSSESDDGALDEVAAAVPEDGSEGGWCWTCQRSEGSRVLGEMGPWERNDGGKGGGYGQVLWRLATWLASFLMPWCCTALLERGNDARC
jgi:hypothetical protein